MLTNVTVTAQAELTPDQIAEAFWNLSSPEQAEFFYHLHVKSGGLLGPQAIYMREACEQHESCAALMALQTIGSHAFKFGLVDERLDKWGLPYFPNEIRRRAA